MTTKRAVAALAAMVSMTMTIPTAGVQAHDRDHTYRGRDGHYHYRCKRSKGTTGTIAGGVGGALVGNALGGGTIGTLAGAGGGALLGRHLDKKHDEAQNRRNGC
jgi:uncharacterized protein YcfJ